MWCIPAQYLNQLYSDKSTCDTCSYSTGNHSWLVVMCLWIVSSRQLVMEWQTVYLQDLRSTSGLKKQKISWHHAGLKQVNLKAWRLCLDPTSPSWAAPGDSEEKKLPFTGRNLEQNRTGLWAIGLVLKYFMFPVQQRGDDSISISLSDPPASESRFSSRNHLL